MADILPKFKLYGLIVIINFFINLGIVLVKPNLNISSIFGLSIGSFVPFVDLTILINTGFPIEVTAFFTMIMLILSSVQVFLLAMFILQTVSNLLWSPNV
jgi:hypothetical protein